MSYRKNCTILGCWWQNPHVCGIQQTSRSINKIQAAPTGLLCRKLFLQLFVFCNGATYRQKYSVQILNILSKINLPHSFLLWLRIWIWYSNIRLFILCDCDAQTFTKVIKNFTHNEILSSEIQNRNFSTSYNFV